MAIPGAWAAGARLKRAEEEHIRARGDSPKLAHAHILRIDQPGRRCSSESRQLVVPIWHFRVLFLNEDSPLSIHPNKRFTSAGDV